MKTNWRLFHQIAPDAKHKQFLFGLNEYVTQQEAIDIALDTGAQAQANLRDLLSAS